MPGLQRIQHLNLSQQFKYAAQFYTNTHTHSFSLQYAPTSQPTSCMSRLYFDQYDICKFRQVLIFLMIFFLKVLLKPHTKIHVGWFDGKCSSLTWHSPLSVKSLCTCHARRWWWPWFCIHVVFQKLQVAGGCHANPSAQVVCQLLPLSTTASFSLDLSSCYKIF